MPRKTPTAELQAEEASVSSPVRRSTRTVAATAKSEPQTDAVNIPAKTLRGRRASQDEDSKDPQLDMKPSTRGRKALKGLEDEAIAVASPGRPRRRTSTSSENDPAEKKLDAPIKTRGRRTSTSSETIIEETEEKTPVVKTRSRRSSVTESVEELEKNKAVPARPKSRRSSVTSVEELPEEKSTPVVRRRNSTTESSQNEPHTTAENTEDSETTRRSTRSKPRKSVDPEETARVSKTRRRSTEIEDPEVEIAPKARITRSRRASSEEPEVALSKPTKTRRLSLTENVVSMESIPETDVEKAEGEDSQTKNIKRTPIKNKKPASENVTNLEPIQEEAKAKDTPDLSGSVKRSRRRIISMKIEETPNAIASPEKSNDIDSSVLKLNNQMQEVNAVVDIENTSSNKKSAPVITPGTPSKNAESEQKTLESPLRSAEKQITRRSPRINKTETKAQDTSPNLIIQLSKADKETYSEAENSNVSSTNKTSLAFSEKCVEASTKINEVSSSMLPVVCLEKISASVETKVSSTTIDGVDGSFEFHLNTSIPNTTLDSQESSGKDINTEDRLNLSTESNKENVFTNWECEGKLNDTNTKLISESDTKQVSFVVEPMEVDESILFSQESISKTVFDCSTLEGKDDFRAMECSRKSEISGEATLLNDNVNFQEEGSPKPSKEDKSVDESYHLILNDSEEKSSSSEEENDSCSLAITGQDKPPTRNTDLLMETRKSSTPVATKPLRNSRSPAEKEKYLKKTSLELSSTIIDNTKETECLGMAIITDHDKPTVNAALPMESRKSRSPVATKLLKEIDMEKTAFELSERCQNTKETKSCDNVSLDITEHDKPPSTTFAVKPLRKSRSPAAKEKDVDKTALELSEECKNTKESDQNIEATTKTIEADKSTLKSFTVEESPEIQKSDRSVVEYDFNLSSDEDLDHLSGNKSNITCSKAPKRSNNFPIESSDSSSPKKCKVDTSLELSSSKLKTNIEDTQKATITSSESEHPLEKDVDKASQVVPESSVLDTQLEFNEASSSTLATEVSFACNPSEVSSRKQTEKEEEIDETHYEHPINKSMSDALETANVSLSSSGNVCSKKQNEESITPSVEQVLHSEEDIPKTKLINTINKDSKVVDKEQDRVNHDNAEKPASREIVSVEFCEDTAELEVPCGNTKNISSTENNLIHDVEMSSESLSNTEEPKTIVDHMASKVLVELNNEVAVNRLESQTKETGMSWEDQDNTENIDEIDEVKNSKCSFEDDKSFDCITLTKKQENSKRKEKIIEELSETESIIDEVFSESSGGASSTKKQKNATAKSVLTPSNAVKCKKEKKSEYKISLEEFANSKMDTFLKTRLKEMQDEDSSDESEGEAYNEFIDGIAEEGEEETPSEDSNEIVDEGESVGFSSDESQHSDSDYENDSFVCDDEEVELLSGNENIDDSKEVPKKKRNLKQVFNKDGQPSEVKDAKWSRILSLDDSSDDEVKVVEDQIESLQNDDKENDVSEKAQESPVIEAAVADVKEQSTPESHNRKSSLTILENINVNEIKESSLGHRINSLVESFCNTIKSQGEIQLNLSLDFEESESSIDRKEVNIAPISPNRTVNITEETTDNGDSVNGLDDSETPADSIKRLSVTLDDDDMKPTEPQRETKRRLSKSLEDLTTESKREIRKKKKRVEVSNSQKSSNKVVKSSKDKGNNKFATKHKNYPVVEKLRAATLNLMDELVTDVKNRERRQIKPSTATDNAWLEVKEIVKPSRTNTETPKQTSQPVGKIHPKDFKSQMLNDKSRIKRIDSGAVLKRKLGRF